MKLGKLIRCWRAMTEQGIRDVAAQIGISSASLSRIENGKPVDGRTMIKLFAWITSEATVKGEA